MIIKQNPNCSIVIIGASGNLALTKLLPALYLLYSSGTLPPLFTITGYSRSKLQDQQYRQLVSDNLKQNLSDTDIESRLLDQFLNRISYISGQYDQVDDFVRLRKELLENNSEFMSSVAVFYLSIPPSVFTAVINSLHKSKCVIKGKNSLHRLVVEKPFGYDTDSAEKLNRLLYKAFDELQIYRIDHYLGKEAIQNLMVLRFANIIFEPVWNRDFIESVMITWEEDKDIGKRAGYFDQAGIIRDVMQNHLLQILSLVAMEQPISLEPESIQDEKVKALRSINDIDMADVILGQYTDGVASGNPITSYLKSEGVPDSSRTETYALLKFEVDNRRWQGVPFYVRAGKALTSKKTEIIIRFKEVPADIFDDVSPNHRPNQLVIRVQPDAALLFHITNKVPGKGMILKDIKLDFSYGAGFQQAMPGAYERLLLDVISGDKTLFISYEELIHSWKLFTPMLENIANSDFPVHPYPAGTSGPAEAKDLTQGFLS